MHSTDPLVDLRIPDMLDMLILVPPLRGPIDLSISQKRDFPPTSSPSFPTVPPILTIRPLGL